ncbi:hypothetical protein, partial [Xanthomonas axonopodis]
MSNEHRWARQNLPLHPDLVKACKQNYPWMTEREVAQAWNNAPAVLQTWLHPYGGGVNITQHPMFASAACLYVHSC